MFRTIAVFILGVYVGQEYGNVIPNVKIKGNEMFEEFTHTNFYKKLSKDFKK